MHPYLTYALLAGLVGLFAFGWWVDRAPDGHRLAPARRFSLVMQLAAMGLAVALLRPGGGTHDRPDALMASVGHGQPVLIDVYSNW